jgi:hypothetical protein
MRWRWPLFALAIAAGVNWYLYERPVSHPPGITVPEQPEVSAGSGETWRDDNGLRYESLARLHIRARLLSRSNVSLSGWNDISPVDLGLAWGEMSDSRVLDQLDISQYSAPISGTRFLFVGIPPESQIAHWSRERIDALFHQATHIHTIPATPEMEQRISHLRPGQIITLEGELVQVEDAQGRRGLTSSTVLGDRDCEVMWVESLELSD